MSLFMNCLIAVGSAMAVIFTINLTVVAVLFLIAWKKGWIKEKPNITPNEIMDKICDSLPPKTTSDGDQK